MFESITEIRSIREQKKRLSEREAELTAPALTDLGLIQTLHAWFDESPSLAARPGKADSVERRKQFILIILSLYSPGTLAGGKMARGLRDRVAVLFGVAPVVISNNLTDAVFLYHRYKPFRQELDKSLAELTRRVGPLSAQLKQ